MRLCVDDSWRYEVKNKLTGVKEDEELEAGHLATVDLEQLQSPRQLLSPLHETRESQSRVRDDARKLNLQHTPQWSNLEHIWSQMSSVTAATFCFSSREPELAVKVKTYDDVNISQLAFLSCYKHFFDRN